MDWGFFCLFCWLENLQTKDKIICLQNVYDFRVAHISFNVLELHKKLTLIVYSLFSLGIPINLQENILFIFSGQYVFEDSYYFSVILYLCGAVICNSNFYIINYKLYNHFNCFVCNPVCDMCNIIKKSRKQRFVRDI